MQKQNKIGILGGTFNPIHNGHIALGIAAYEQFALDKVWVMVSKTPPHKSGLAIPSAQIRADMVKLAVAEIPFMEFSDFELQREGYIYTAETLTMLSEIYPETEFYFIIGGDSLDEFEHWYHPEIILSKAVILASGRNALQNEKLDLRIKELKQIFSSADIRKISLPEIPYSSTQIRKLAAMHKDISVMVNENVAGYIKEYHIYGERGDT
jgi:nicotinate-nucleotide adenylyltransferase